MTLGLAFDLAFQAAATKVKVKMDSRLPHSGMTVRWGGGSGMVVLVVFVDAGAGCFNRCQCLLFAFDIHIAGVFEVFQCHHVAKLARFGGQVMFVVGVQAGGDRQPFNHVHSVAG